MIKVSRSFVEGAKKDIDKCELVIKAYETRSFNYDALIQTNIRILSALEVQQAEKKAQDKALLDLNQKYNKALKQKKTSWIIPVAGALAVGFGVGVSL